MSTSHESWHVSFMRPIAPPGDTLVLAAAIMPPSLLHNVLGD